MAWRSQRCLLRVEHPTDVHARGTLSAAFPQTASVAHSSNAAARRLNSRFDSFPPVFRAGTHARGAADLRAALRFGNHHTPGAFSLDCGHGRAAAAPFLVLGAMGWPPRLVASGRTIAAVL